MTNDACPQSYDVKVLLRYAPGLKRYPYIGIEKSSQLSAIALKIIANNDGDFAWSNDFSPGFLTDLMRHGFLTMATSAGPELFALLPKLHRERCVLSVDEVHVQKNSRKRAKKFRITSNTAFDEVIEGLRAQHGTDCWLYDPLVKSLRQIMMRPGAYDQPRGVDSVPVRVHTFEVWEDADGPLAAGEIGYSVGKIYTSLSGFSRVSSAGSVQMAATGALLRREGCTLWDLGMGMEYKMALGATLMPRRRFVEAVTAARATRTPLDFADLHSRATTADTVLLANAPCPAAARPAVEPPSPGPRPGSRLGSLSSLVGRRVELRGLGARPDLNGAHGVVVGAVEESERCLVQMDGGSGTFKIKRENLLFME